MKKLLICALMFLVMSVNLYALDFGAGVGAYVPMGDAKDKYDVGYALNAYVGKSIVPHLVDVRLFANYYAADGREHGIKYEIDSVGGGAMVVVAPPLPVVHPYAGLGYALNRTKHGPVDDRETKWGHGMFAQAGVNVSLLLVTVGVSGTYFINNVGSDDLGGFAFGLNAGIAF